MLYFISLNRYAISHFVQFLFRIVYTYMYIFVIHYAVIVAWLPFDLYFNARFIQDLFNADITHNKLITLHVIKYMYTCRWRLLFLPVANEQGLAGPELWKI